MALGYPTDKADTYESQQFGPANPSAGGYWSQPAMFGHGSSVAWWQAYKGWAYYPHYHNGLDIAGPEGKPLLAMESGKVTHSGLRDNGGGIVVEVEIRPGTRYTFNHCSAALVRVGAIVKKGQAIARIGSTGVATGNHCHVSLDIRERGADGWDRELIWNPKLWMAGGAYANDGRITPAYALVPRLSAGINGNGVNIRSTPRMTSAALYAVTRDDRIRRYSDNADIRSRTARMRYYREVQGDMYVINGVASNRYVEFYLGGGKRYVAKPFASKVGWYTS